MRPKTTQQRGLDFNQSSLKLTNEYYAKYENISEILDANPQILDQVHADVGEVLESTQQKDNRGNLYKYTTENVLRILLAQTIENLSLRGIVIRIDDSDFLRRFVRIDNGLMMDHTNLCKLKNAIRPQTWAQVNKLLAQHAVRNDLIKGDKLRVDTTAVETNVHWPTDSSLLWDTYHVLARLLDQARDIDPESVGNQRLQTRRAKKIHTRISRKASKKPQATEALKPLYSQLLLLVGSICDWSVSVAEALQDGLETRQYSSLMYATVEAIVEQIGHYQGLGRQVIDQASRRVLAGEKVPNDQKLFSIFEPHTELLIRGKAGKAVEFGHMIQIQQVGEKFITDYGVYEHKPVEYQLLEPALQSHKELFGEYPRVLTADKGYYQDMTSIGELSKKVDMVSIAKKGKCTDEERAREVDPVFRHAQRFRAGVEGTISFLKRVLGMSRCYNKGWEQFVCTVGVTVFAHNLLLLARC